MFAISIRKMEQKQKERAMSNQAKSLLIDGKTLKEWTLDFIDIGRCCLEEDNFKSALAYLKLAVSEIEEFTK